MAADEPPSQGSAAAEQHKREVAARVEWSGAGLDPRTGTPAREAVLKAVHTVLTEPGHRRRADELRDEFGRFDASANGAEAVACVA
ncbi:hypothetical protein [Streptomyces bluensis]|uniref:hypothetical protein n=1 Tax=Streptomyces bluensis TaxID=33897 RepID=UPI00332CE482